MDFTKWISNISSSRIADALTSKLESLQLQGDCFQRSQSCTTRILKRDLHFSMSEPHKEEEKFEVLERRRPRGQKEGLREDEREFIDYRGGITEEAVSCTSPPASEAELRTPQAIGPPMLETPTVVAQRTVTSTSDIESVRTTEDIETSVEDSCNAMHMIQTASKLTHGRKKVEESVQTNPLPSARKASDHWVRSSSAAPFLPSYRCLEEPADGPAREVSRFEALYKLLFTVGREEAIRLKEMSNIILTSVVNRDVYRGDIIHIERGSVGVGRDQTHVSTVVVSTMNTARRGTVHKEKAKEFYAKSVAADCRLWDLVFPLKVGDGLHAKPSGACWATPDRNGQTKPLRCWGVWRLPLDSLRVACHKKKNCVAFFLNCYLILVATQSVLRGERLYFYANDAEQDIKTLMLEPGLPAETIGEDEHETITQIDQQPSKAADATKASSPPASVDSKPKIGQFPASINVDQSATNCATITTSASEESPVASPLSKKAPSCDEQLQVVADEMSKHNIEQVKDSLKRWPSLSTVNLAWKLHQHFATLINIGMHGHRSPLLDSLLRQTAPFINLVRPCVEDLQKAPNVEDYINKHNLITVAGSVRPLYKIASATYDMAEALCKSSTPKTQQPSD